MDAFARAHDDLLPRRQYDPLITVPEMTRERRAIKAACPNLHAIPARERREGNVIVLEYAHGDVVPTPRATVLPVRVR